MAFLAILGAMHKTLGQRDPATAFPLAHGRDDADERRQANRAVAVSAIGLAATGLVELLLALLTGMACATLDRTRPTRIADSGGCDGSGRSAKKDAHREPARMPSRNPGE